MKEETQKFKMQLNFTSYVKLSMLIGFCFGIASIPLVLLGNYSKTGEIHLLFIIFATPIVCFLNGILAAVLGYPLYKFISKKVALKYNGKLFINE